jgi:ABC-type phosphate transport system substrate-binding protein
VNRTGPLIQVVVRSDSSGTVNVFTRSLSTFSATWNRLIGYGDSVIWANTNLSLSVIHYAYLTQGTAEQVAGAEFSIGFLASSEALSFGLPVAQMVNRAGVVVEPSSSAIQYAVMDLGSELDAHMTAVLIDSGKQNAWPMTSFTYFALRQTARCVLDSDCTAKFAVGTLFGWFYQTAAVSEAATALGYTSLPDSLCAIVLEHMRQHVLCDSHSILQISSNQLSVVGSTFLLPFMNRLDFAFENNYPLISLSYFPLVTVNDVSQSFNSILTSFAILSLPALDYANSDFTITFNFASSFAASSYASLPFGVNGVFPIVHLSSNCSRALSSTLTLSLPVLLAIYQGGFVFFVFCLSALLFFWCYCCFALFIFRHILLG